MIDQRSVWLATTGIRIPLPPAFIPNGDLAMFCKA
jgi:hypothetical protein